MADVLPFRALRPRDDLASRVIAPPYDVLSVDNARQLASDPYSFVHVTRSEVDLEVGADPHSSAAYQKARENLDQLVSSGVLVHDEQPTYYLYGQRMGEHEQVGVLAAASVEEYDQGAIAKHEYTRPDKEDDRTHHMDVLDAQVGLVFLAYRPTDRLDRLLADLSSAEPAWSVTTEDDVVHRLWPVPQGAVSQLREALSDLGRLYIADGHHRSAAASRIHAKRNSAGSAYFLAGLYPADRLEVMSYNRVVNDLNGHTPESFLDAVSHAYEVERDGPDTPTARGEVAMHLDGQWFRLRARPRVRSTDPVSGLDVAILQDHVLNPILGIDDPRRSTRLRFVGGIHGPQALKTAVAEGAGVAFHLFPTGLDQLFAVADAGEVMPPKSTWFEPKLREGVVVRPL
ncbi:MAG: DUF1015 family protein [Myxococcales bacterium]|nr:DUF1015 family protein [Myxococcales bacterium]